MTAEVTATGAGESVVTRAAENTMTGTGEGMVNTIAEALAIIVKAMTNRDLISEYW